MSSFVIFKIQTFTQNLLLAYAPICNTEISEMEMDSHLS